MKDRASYLPAHTFAEVVLDLVMPSRPPGAATTYLDLYRSLQSLPFGFRASLTTLVQSGGNTLDDAQRAIERWYNDAMDRTSGTYKRTIQLWILSSPHSSPSRSTQILCTWPAGSGTLSTVRQVARYPAEAAPIRVA